MLISAAANCREKARSTAGWCGGFGTSGSDRFGFWGGANRDSREGRLFREQGFLRFRFASSRFLPAPCFFITSAFWGSRLRTPTTILSTCLSVPSWMPSTPPCRGRQEIRWTARVRTPTSGTRWGFRNRYGDIAPNPIRSEHSEVFSFRIGFSPEGPESES